MNELEMNINLAVICSILLRFILRDGIYTSLH